MLWLVFVFLCFIGQQERSVKFHEEMLGNLEVLKSRSIDRFFLELTVAEARQNAQSRASP